MKYLLPFLIMLGILGQTFLRTAYTLHYQWNRAIYLKNCENLDKPDLQCDGKCYLRKRINATEAPSGAAPELPQHFFEIKDAQLFYESIPLLSIALPEDQSVAVLPPWRSRRIDDPLLEVIAPPS